MKLSALFIIGHGSYRGANAQALFKTEQGVIRELVSRGVDAAVAQLKLLEAKAGSHVTMSNVHGDVIELVDAFERAKAEDWPVLHYDLRAWKAQEAYQKARRGQVAAR